MTHATGIDWNINRILASTQYPLGGKLVGTPVFTMGGSTFSEPGSGDRELATPPSTHSVIPRLEFAMNIQRFSDLIAPIAAPFYVFATGEAALNDTSMIFTDGLNDVELSGGHFDSCEVAIRYGEAIKATLVYIGGPGHNDSVTYGTHEKRTEEPIKWTGLTTLKLATDTIANWRNVTFRVNNNVVAKHLGVDILPTLSFEKAAEYSGTIARSLTGDSEAADVKAGTKKDVEIQITDNQTVPVITKFLFDDANLEVSREEVPELDLILETITWNCAKVLVTNP